MVEAIAQQSLVKTTYFISPEFWGLHSFRDWIDDFDGEKGSRWDRSTKMDEKDIFPEWFTTNSIDNQIYGANGVRCDISHKEIFDQDKAVKVGEIVRKKNGYLRYSCKEPYRRVLTINSMPSSRELPQELSDALREIQYDFCGLENQFIKVLERVDNRVGMAYLRKYDVGKYIDHKVFKENYLMSLIPDRIEQ